MQRKARISFETALAQKAASNPKEFFGHLQRDSRLRTQITTLKDSSSEPLTDPTSQAETLADRIRAIHRLDTGKPTPPTHREAQPSTLLRHLTPTKDRGTIHAIRQFARKRQPEWKSRLLTGSTDLL